MSKHRLCGVDWITCVQLNPLNVLPEISLPLDDYKPNWIWFCFSRVLSKSGGCLVVVRLLSQPFVRFPCQLFNGRYAFTVRRFVRTQQSQRRHRNCPEFCQYLIKWVSTQILHSSPEAVNKVCVHAGPDLTESSQGIHVGSTFKKWVSMLDIACWKSM